MLYKPMYLSVYRFDICLSYSFTLVLKTLKSADVFVSDGRVFPICEPLTRKED